MPALPRLPCSADLRFKTADCPGEFEAIHRLNHRTFAEEIPQHETTSDGRLVDRFHERNLYHIALRGESLAGMVALRFDRPFSVEQKIPETMDQVPAGHRWCEIRLLAVEPRHRGSALLAGLIRGVIKLVRDRGCDAAMISATTRQLKLYQHLGFEPFGHLIGREGAWYQPMWITVDRLKEAVPLLDPQPSREPLNLLPGPVAVAVPDYVRSAFHRPAVSHRSPEALRMVREIRSRLETLTGAGTIALLAGGGTLANDVVAGQLRRLGQPGVVLIGGEFGKRLADHATRMGLGFRPLHMPGDQRVSGATLEDFLDAHPDTGWVWLAHCETSTGILNPLTELAGVCAARGVKLCADCVSSLGVAPVDLRGIWLASGASGKGLAAYPGVALVFSHHLVLPAGESLPRALDLGMYHAAEGMPFTLGSNVLAALHAALTLTDWTAKMELTSRHGGRLRRRLARAGFHLSGPDRETSPAVLTLTLPEGVVAADFAALAEEQGYLLAAHSPYLRERNQAQICLMGALRERDTRHLPTLLAGLLKDMGP